MVGGRGEEQDFDAARGGFFNHADPRGAGFFETDAAVVEGVVEGEDIGAVAEDFGFETRCAALGIFAADGGDDDIDDGEGITRFEFCVEEVRVGLEGFDDRR